MSHVIPLCPLCETPIARDNCGPIEGGLLWFRTGDAVPSAPREGAEGSYAWVCGRCLARSVEQ